MKKIEGEANAVNHFDVCLAGAGGAGILLLHAMHKHIALRKLRILVIEPEAKTANDRTWCFWAKAEDPILKDLQDIISGEWEQVIAGESSFNLLPNRYFQIRSADLYAFVKDKLKDFSCLHWHQSSLNSVEYPNNQALILHTATKQFRCDMLFDSRPEPRTTTGLKQSFFGYRIRTKKPIKNPKKMHLMHFSDSCGDDSKFWYVLPTSKHEALVELTSFSQSIIDKSKAATSISNYAEELFGEYTIVEKEFGVLPMQNHKVPITKSPKHQVIGVSGGAIRGTTGYAFKKMYEHANSIGVALLEQHRPPPIKTNIRHQFYDRLLLDILNRKPEAARNIFVRLFERVNISDVLSFMEGKSSIAAEMHVIWALNWPPFLSAAWRSLPKFTLLVFFLLIFSLGIQLSLPSLLDKFVPFLLLAGMIFPGLPHGAVDQLLSTQFRSTPLFIIAYLAIMLLVVALWLISPMIALVFFLTYSAWHFGQTDFEHWALKSGAKSLGYGLGVLGIILLGHLDESLTLIKGLGIEIGIPQPIFGIGLSLLLLLLPLTKLKRSKYPSFWFGFMVLLAGSLLPLLLAFGFYFIGIHSRRGWQHLEIGLKKSSLQLLQIAFPYQLSAWLLFTGLAISNYWFSWSFDGWIPVFFVFLAAISSPHILLMHFFYRNKFRIAAS